MTRHGTPAGYTTLHCRGSQCEAPISCTQARIRYVGDYQYMRRVDAGMTPQEIANIELVEAVEARTLRLQLAREARELARPRARRIDTAFISHGSAHGGHGGYGNGCRDSHGPACPNVAAGLISCTQFMKGYTALRKSRRELAAVAV